MVTEKNKNKKPEGFIEELELKDINAVLDGNEIVLSKNEKEVRRKLNTKIQAKVENGKIILSSKKASKREKKILFSLKAHIKNAIEGLANPFKYKLQAVSVHFPMTLEVEKTKNLLLVKNFLGEKKPREIMILPGVEVKVNKDKIEVESADVEKAGQTAANIEKGSRIRFRDRRIFQDGIFITEKPGVIYS